MWRERMKDKVLTAAANAAATLTAVYQWVDMVEEAGGTGSIAGIAKCHAMIESLKKNRGRMDSLIIAPIREALGEKA